MALFISQEVSDRMARDYLRYLTAGDVLDITYLHGDVHQLVRNALRIAKIDGQRPTRLRLTPEQALDLKCRSKPYEFTTPTQYKYLELEVVG